MEARNFITAREMVVDGHWLYTTLDGMPRYQKPPLPTWITALFGKVFGWDHTWALRLPSALMSFILSISFYEFVRKLTKDREQAFVATLVMLTSFLIIFAGRNGTWDIYTHTFMIVGILFLLRMLNLEKQLYLNAVIAGLCLGLSFMSKGPVSHFTLLVPFVFAYLITYRVNNLKRKVWPLILLGITTIAVSAWWPLFIYFGDTTVATRITEAETTSWQHKNVRPFWYYFSFVIQSGAWAIISLVALCYPYLKKKVTNIKAYRFACLWVLFSIVLLSLIPEKKSRYLLPVLIPLGLVTSFYLNVVFQYYKTHFQNWEKLPVIINFGIIGVAGIISPIGLYIYFGDLLNPHLFWLVLLSIALICLGSGIIYFLFKQNIKKTFFVSIAFIASVIVFGFPITEAFYNNPSYKTLSNLKSSSAEKGLEIYTIDGLTPEHIWDYGDKLSRLIQNDSFTIPNHNTFGLLVRYNFGEHYLDSIDGYTSELRETYDLNILDSTQSGHKDRLKSKFYLLKKETD